MPTTFLKEPSTRKWIMQVLLVLLLFGLMAWVAWLYYNYELQQLNKKTGCHFTSTNFFPF